MPQDRGAQTRLTLVGAATDLIRRQGYTATSVDDVCAQARVTKGAFFHHFKTKDRLVEACLAQWDGGAAAMEARAPFQSIAGPHMRAIGYMDFYIGLFDSPGLLKSCLAGTTVQEIGTNTPLREAAHSCFANACGRFKALLDDACQRSRGRIDTAGLASLWMAAIQGSLILYKASQDTTVIRRNLEHVKTYITSQLPPATTRTTSRRKRRSNSR
jgi:TetR/AcrR family transcriptional repressor of nem operon